MRGALIGGVLPEWLSNSISSVTYLPHYEISLDWKYDYAYRIVTRPLPNNAGDRDYRYYFVTAARDYGFRLDAEPGDDLDPYTDVGPPSGTVSGWSSLAWNIQTIRRQTGWGNYTIPQVE